MSIWRLKKGKKGKKLIRSKEGLHRVPLEEWEGDLSPRTRHKKITAVDLSENKLSHLPRSFFSTFSQLQRLDLQHNQLEELPASSLAVAAHHLKELKLGHNRLVEIPASIGQLTALQILLLHNNHLKQLPGEMGQLSSLRFLQLNHNRLFKVPKELWKCQQLRFLYLHENRLTVLPTELHVLRGTLRELSAHRNPLYFPPQNVVLQGTDVMLSFLERHYKLKLQRMAQELYEAASTNGSGIASDSKNRGMGSLRRKGGGRAEIKKGNGNDITLLAMLEDPVGLSSFRKFLEKEHSGENLRFWEAVRNWKNLFNININNIIAFEKEEAKEEVEEEGILQLDSYRHARARANFESEQVFSSRSLIPPLLLSTRENGAASYSSPSLYSSSLLQGGSRKNPKAEKGPGHRRLTTLRKQRVSLPMSIELRSLLSPRIRHPTSAPTSSSSSSGQPPSLPVTDPFAEVPARAFSSSNIPTEEEDEGDSSSSSTLSTISSRFHSPPPSPPVLPSRRSNKNSQYHRRHRREEARKVYLQFIASQSELQVNLPSHLRRELDEQFSATGSSSPVLCNEGKIIESEEQQEQQEQEDEEDESEEEEDIKPDVFDKCVEHVLSMMETDSYARYVRTLECDNVKERLRGKQQVSLLEALNDGLDSDSDW
ncbi:Regulator of G-protein signaling 7 [Balamuthia mandrillaris]